MLLEVTFMYFLVIFLVLSVFDPDKESGASFRKRHDQRVMHTEIPILRVPKELIC